MEGCVAVAGAVVCSPSTYKERRFVKCPTCRRRRLMLAVDALWYGVTLTCLACGDSWSDGERHERPFRRGWRAEARSRARRIASQCAPRSDARHRAWVREMLGD